MLRILKILAMLVAGTVLGLAATWATAIRGTMGGDIEDGPWGTSLYIGSSESSPYLRARIAVHGLLALSRKETLYYTAPRGAITIVSLIDPVEAINEKTGNAKEAP